MLNLIRKGQIKFRLKKKTLNMMLINFVLVTTFIFNSRSSANLLQNAKQCIILSDININGCSKIKRIGLKRRDGDVNGSCPHNNICRRNLSISIIRMQMYTKSIIRQLSYMLDNCCGNCTSYYFRKMIPEMSGVNSDVLSSSDLVFPFLGSRSQTEMYGAYYLPVFDVPSAYYITLIPTSYDKMRELFYGCMSTWPLIVICIILSIISGFVIWTIERHKNPIEFPKRFHSGLYEGFWWSFISMTTVGYGDRSPKTFPGRIFAVGWVLIGITMFSILTGELTNQISKIKAEPSQALLGKTVGGLVNKLHDVTMTTQHSGFFKTIPFNNTVRGVSDLIEMLSKKEIDGILINFITYYHYRHKLQYHPERYDERIVKLYREVSLHFSEKAFVGEKKTLGILIKDYDVYMYFKRYFEDNMLQIENCKSYLLNKRGVKYGMTRKKLHMEKSFLIVLYSSLAVVGMIFFVGIIIEIRRRYFQNHWKEKEVEIEEMEIE